MLLRDYQQSAIEQYLSSPHVPTLIVAPTGAGKGTMAAYVLSRYAMREHRAIFLVHRRELVHDMARRLVAQGVTAGRSLHSPRLVSVISVQAALHAAQTRRPDLLVVDEAHHYAAEEWQEVVSRLRPRALLGFTATPQRADGKPLGDMFARLIDAVPYSLLLARGVIVPCRVLRAPRRMHAQEIARDPVDAYLKHARGQPALIYVARIGEAARVADALRARGVRAEHVHARTPRHVRDALLAQLRAGVLDVLVNVGILTEGVDLPGVRCIVLARPCHHASTYLQIVGRGLRAAPGKSEATLIDLVGASHVHGLPAEDRLYDLTGTGIAEPSNLERDDREITREAWAVESLDLELEEIAPGARPVSRPTPLRLVGRPKSTGQTPGGIFISRGYWMLTCRVDGAERRITLATRDKLVADELLAIYRTQGVEALESAIHARRVFLPPRLYRHTGATVWWADALGRDGATREQFRLYTRDRAVAEQLRDLLAARDFRAFDRQVAALAETFERDTGKRARAERTSGFVFVSGKSGYYSIGYSENGTKYRVSLATKDKLRAESYLQLYREDGIEAVRAAVAKSKERTTYHAALWWDPSRGGKWRCYVSGPGTPRRSVSLGTRDPEVARRIRELWLAGDEPAFRAELERVKTDAHESSNAQRKETLRQRWREKWNERRVTPAD